MFFSGTFQLHLVNLWWFIYLGVTFQTKKLSLSVRFRQVPSLKLTVHTWKWVPKKGLSSSNNWIFRGYDNFTAVTPPKFDIFAPEKWYKWWLEDDLASYWVPVGNFSGAIHPGRLTWNLNITHLKRKIHLPNLHFEVPCEKLQGLYYIFNFHFRAGWGWPACNNMLKESLPENLTPQLAGTTGTLEPPRTWTVKKPNLLNDFSPGHRNARWFRWEDGRGPCSMPHDAHGAWDGFCIFYLHEWLNIYGKCMLSKYSVPKGSIVWYIIPIY